MPPGWPNHIVATKAAAHHEGLHADAQVTMEQLDRVFGVPETVEAIKELFAEANPNLLEAHEMMRGMEVARDHLMAQLETQAKTKRSATAAVTSYFQGLVECEDLLLSAFEPA